jgi:hypothetical protein
VAIIGTTNKLGLAKPEDGHQDWGQDVRDNYDKLEARLTLSNAGDPNGAVTSDFAGQWLWDTANNYWWVARSAGVNNDWQNEYNAETVLGVSVAMGMVL